jgi:hypothetical protein
VKEFELERRLFLRELCYVVCSRILRDFVEANGRPIEAEINRPAVRKFVRNSAMNTITGVMEAQPPVDDEFEVDGKRGYQPTIVGVTHLFLLALGFPWYDPSEGHNSYEEEQQDFRRYIVAYLDQWEMGKEKKPLKPAIGEEVR